MTAGDAPHAGSRPQHAVEVAIAIVFDRAGRLLVCRRKSDTVLGGYWEFPGGKCHAGESPAACAVRETQEETALLVHAHTELPVIEHDYPHARVRLHPFLCLHAGGTLACLQVAEARWIDPRTIGHYRFPEANQHLIDQLARGMLSPPCPLPPPP